MTLPIAPKATAKHLARVLADLTDDLDDARPVIWYVGVGELSRWDRWWLRRRLGRLTPDHVTLELDPRVSGEHCDIPNLPCWVHVPGTFVPLRGGTFHGGIW